MEERFRTLTHKGQTIVLLDLSGLQDEKEIIRLIKMRSNLQTPHGLLVDLTRPHFSRNIMKEAKESSKDVQPLLKAYAVVGTGSVIGMMVSGISRFIGMHIATFDTRQEALDWLAKEIGKK